MVTLNARELKAKAKTCLETSRNNTRSLVLIYTVTLVVLSLVANGLNVYLNNQISGTGGLAGLGTRSILQTVQQVVTYFYSFFTPFWQAGFLYTVIRNARTEQTEYSSLFFGFRRILRILSHSLALIAVTFLLALAACNLASNLFLLTPFADPLTELLLPLMEQGTILSADGMLDLTAIPMDALIKACTPLLILCLVIFIPAYIFVNYCFRMSLYLLVQGPEIGGIGSLVASWKLMRGHKLELLKLDLSYWWYYALGILITAVCYLDTILPLLGITLPINATAAYFVTLILYGLLTIALYVWKKWEVDTAYVLAYEAITYKKREL